MSAAIKGLNAALLEGRLGMADYLCCKSQLLDAVLASRPSAHATWANQFVV